MEFNIELKNSVLINNQQKNVKPNIKDISIKNKILIMSGKGGVGKTALAVNLAYLASTRFSTGIIDVDIHGPNVPKMLGLNNDLYSDATGKIIPILRDSLKVVSIGFLLNKTDSVIWRGPLKHKLINQFIYDVNWGNLDFLFIDFPPGTGDEALSVSQLLKDITGSVIISSPQDVAMQDAVRTIDFSKRLNIPILGLVENMSGDIFGQGKVKKIADEFGVEFLGSVPLLKDIRQNLDLGQVEKTAHYFEDIFNKILSSLNTK